MSSIKRQAGEFQASKLTVTNQYSLPETDGTPGQVPTTDGAGVVSWQSNNSSVVKFNYNNTITPVSSIPIGEFAFQGDWSSFPIGGNGTIAISSRDANDYGVPNILTMLDLNDDGSPTASFGSTVILSGLGGVLLAASIKTGTKTIITGGYKYDVVVKALSQGYVPTSGQALTFNFAIHGDQAGLSGAGDLNYLTKWTPDGTTLGNSLIQDNGNRVSINSSIQTDTFLFIIGKTDTLTAAKIKSFYTFSGARGLECDVTQVNSFSNTGIYSFARNSSTSNIGGQFAADDNGQGGANYALKLQDGSQAAGKVLADVTGQGETNFVKVDSTYTTGATGSFTSADGKTITVTNGLITSIV